MPHHHNFKLHKIRTNRITKEWRQTQSNLKIITLPSVFDGSHG